ncbi:hypothetical protein L7D48_07030 [Streptomyces sp. S1A]|uniref:ABC transporter permease n=1 Tax=Streptomyces chitinivorans TaxID=1257027 RepID=A0ABW7HT39_9ACTN|nr:MULTISPECIES: hypothetical protein [Streptomyces]MCG3040326.1 hypothetical protein [Streptomyces sp. ICN903]MDH2410261.1 hypothetical protein [Streptomyces chitinivorans]
MPGDAPRTPNGAKTEQPGRLGCAYLTVKANPGALAVVIGLLAFAAWQLWPLVALALGR